ncbi:MAG: helicase, partial [Burkholderiales bacterium PBB4]
MHGLVDAVRGVFCEGGVLAQALPGHVYRQGQADMANAVAETLESGGQLVVEAGTGIGKTFAYLVPVLLSGKRAILSTATKALQDQLAYRDIPRILSGLHMQVRVSVLKGYSSYLCLHRLDSIWNTAGQNPQGGAGHLGHIKAWSAVTQTGDFAELADSSGFVQFASALASTRENCLGSDCPKWTECFITRARQRALDSDLVVVNHHVFLFDMRLDESGAVARLPSAPVVVFDEAHHLNEVGVRVLGQRLQGWGLQQFCRDVLDVGQVLALGAKDWRTWLHAASHVMDLLTAMVTEVSGSADPHWNEEMQAPDGVDAVAWLRCCLRLKEAMAQIVLLLKLLESSDTKIAALRKTGDAQLRLLQYLMDPTPVGSFKWLELSPHLNWGLSPANLGPSLGAYFSEAQARGGKLKSWVFTSSTLGGDPEGSRFRLACGLEQARFLRLASPFNYSGQSWLYVPEVFPAPTDPLHSLEVARFVSQAASVLRGSTLVLTTSIRAMNVIGLALRQHFALHKGLEVLIQGDMPKVKIAQKFERSALDLYGGVVVVASNSFWEGIDLPGEALRLVVIDRLPFAPP